jgi:tetratricopeptide (TPR) repeat protein
MRPKHDGTVFLDTSFVETRMAQLGVKQYWLAEQLGVSPRTVLRWVNGQVRRIQREHLAPLAALLECTPDQLSPTAGDDAGVADARAEAARRIADEDILTLLTPTSSYPMAEALIKASLTPGLASHTRGKLLNMLSLAVGRQFRIEEAIAYAAQAAEIGRDLGNQVMVVRAWYAEGMARLYAGEIAEARRRFQRCVDDLDYLDEDYDAAMAWFGLGACQGYDGEIESALASLARSIAELEPLARPMDQSMPLDVRGVLLLEAKRLDEARADLERSLELATRIGWNSGKGRATAALAHVAAQRGELAGGVELYENALAIVREERFVHPQLFLSGAHVHRLAGNIERALAELERGLDFAEKYRPEREALERLRAELTDASGAS